MNEIAYAVDLPKIAESKSTLACTRLIAKIAIERQYMTTRELLEELSEIDLRNLVSFSMVGADDPNNQLYQEFFLFSLVFITAEGSTSIKTDNIEILISQMVRALAFEGLNRRGIVDFYPEKIVFGEEMNNDDIAIIKPEKMQFAENILRAAGYRLSDESPDNTDKPE